MALLLPIATTGAVEINRLLRELNALNDFFISANARKTSEALTLPQTTQMLEDLAKANKLNLLEEKDRAKLVKQLTDSLTKAPKLHISFAVEPPPKVVETILNWLRQNLDPGILLDIGLQPNIGAGCVLRTANREFDMSMRQQLIDSKGYLSELIDAAGQRQPPVTTTTPAPAAAQPTAPQPSPGPQPSSQPGAQT